MTEANEFWKIYKLGCRRDSRPIKTITSGFEFPDVIYLTEDFKYKALAEEIERTNKWDVLVLKDGTETVGQDRRRARRPGKVRQLERDEKDVESRFRVRKIQQRSSMPDARYWSVPSASRKSEVAESVARSTWRCEHAVLERESSTNAKPTSSRRPVASSP